MGGVSRTSSPYFCAGEDGGLGIRELTESVSAPSKNCVGFVLVRAGFRTEREQLSNVRARASRELPALCNFAIEALRP